MKSQSAFESDCRQNSVGRRAFAQDKSGKRDIAGETCTFLCGQIAAGQALILCQRIFHDFEKLRRLLKELLAIDRALIRKVFARRGMRDEFDAGEAVAIDLIPTDVIVVPVSVDDVLDGFVCYLAERCK